MVRRMIMFALAALAYAVWYSVRAAQYLLWYQQDFWKAGELAGYRDIRKEVPNA